MAGFAKTFLAIKSLETRHVLNPDQHHPALLTMVAVSRLAMFENVRERRGWLDFYLNKNNLKQGASKELVRQMSC
jgi:hypothetical protein